jgi:hypothetical protein
MAKIEAETIKNFGGESLASAIRPSFSKLEKEKTSTKIEWKRKFEEISNIEPLENCFTPVQQYKRIKLTESTEDYEVNLKPKIDKENQPGFMENTIKKVSKIQAEKDQFLKLKAEKAFKEAQATAKKGLVLKVDSN